MIRAVRFGWMPVLLALAASASAQHHHGGAIFASHGSYGHHSAGGGGPVVVGYGHHGGGGGYSLGAVGGGYGGFGGYGFGVPYYYPTPLIVTGPILLPPILPAFPMGQGGGGLMLPMPPVQQNPPANAARPRRPNPDRAKELVEIGDRSFRGGNIHRAEERYFLAAKADPTAPMPFIHLAQVSMVRKDYSIAAERIRTALDTAQGSAWLANAPDIQTMFGEPGDFARHMANIESHLQTNPGDRDAWFLLGVEWYLSGRTQQAADAFRRLTDRRPDPALAAFLDATNLRRPAAN